MESVQVDGVQSVSNEKASMLMSSFLKQHPEAKTKPTFVQLSFVMQAIRKEVNADLGIEVEEEEDAFGTTEEVVEKKDSKPKRMRIELESSSDEDE